LNLFDVATGASIYEKKSFTQIGFLEALGFILSNLLAEEVRRQAMKVT